MRPEKQKATLKSENGHRSPLQFCDDQYFIQILLIFLHRMFHSAGVERSGVSDNPVVVNPSIVVYAKHSRDISYLKICYFSGGLRAFAAEK